MPPLNVSVLHDIAQTPDVNAPVGKARLASFFGTVVRILWRFDCDWDVDDIPHDRQLWGVSPLSIRLFQKYNREATAKAYPSFCTIVWIADQRSTPPAPPSRHGSGNYERATKRRRCDEELSPSSFSSSSSSSSSTVREVGSTGKHASLAAGIKRKAQDAEVVVIDSSSDDGDDDHESTDEEPKNKRQKMQREKVVAMILPWLEQADVDLYNSLRPGVSIEIRRAVLHVSSQLELLACIFNVHTTIQVRSPDPMQRHATVRNGSQPRDNLFQLILSGRVSRMKGTATSFDALQYYDPQPRYDAQARERGHVRGHSADAKAEAIVNEIKLVDAQTRSFHFHYLMDLYNTLATFLYPSSGASATTSPGTLASSSSKTFPPHLATLHNHHHAATASRPQQPPCLPLSVYRVHRFLCWITSLRTIHLRVVCAECGHNYKVDRCEFGCSVSRKWQVRARATCIVSDGTGSAWLHVDREQDVWTLLRLSAGDGEDADGRKAKLLRLLVRMGELAYSASSSAMDANGSGMNASTRAAAMALPRGSSSSSASSNKNSPQQVQQHLQGGDMSERGRTERELWTSICEYASSSSKERLVLYARIKDHEAATKRQSRHAMSNSSRSGDATGGITRLHKGRFWIGGRQPITTLFQSRVTLECLTLDRLANNDNHSPLAQYMSPSKKTSVIESRLLLNKLLNK